MMEQEKLAYFLALYGRYYPEEKIPQIIEKLKALPEGSFGKLNTIRKKDPTSVLMYSFYLGYFGIDRMMIGQIRNGLLKLLIIAGIFAVVSFGVWTMNIAEISKILLSTVLMGTACIWVLIDWFTIEKQTKKYNYDKLTAVLENWERID